MLSRGHGEEPQGQAGRGRALRDLTVLSSPLLSSQTAGAAGDNQYLWMTQAKWTKVRQGTRSQLSDNIDRVMDMALRPLTLDSCELLFSLLLILGVFRSELPGNPADLWLASSEGAQPRNPWVSTSNYVLPACLWSPNHPPPSQGVLFRPPVLRNRWLLFGQRQGLGALSQEMRNRGKQGTAVCLLCRPQGLVLCH